MRLPLRSIALCLAAQTLLATAALAQNLRVYAIDIGQGSSTLIVSPTGKTMLIDGGPDQSGWITSPSGPGPIAQLMTTLGIAQLDFTLLTHYHSDHYEGLTELAQHNYLKPTAKAYDRGNSPAPENGFTSPINTYISAMGAKRTTIVLGEVIDLGGGCTVRCLVKAGSILGGPTITTSTSAQEENSNSIGVKLEYGNFDMWIGGDLTGGGGGTSDVEGPAGPFVGNLDVYVADHHGSSTSSNAAWITATQPELAIASCGLHNSFNHPSGTFLNNTNSAARSILVYSTSGGADNDGFGNNGFVNAAGTIRLDVNGNTYDVVPTVGRAQTLVCDELSSTYGTPLFGDLRISEYLADPTTIPDADGEWFEITNVSGFERNLNGLRISQVDGANLFTLASTIVLKPGEKFVVHCNGDHERNGGTISQFCEPFNVFALGNSSDSIRLRNASNVLIDDMSYTGSWPDATGIAGEKRDLLGSNVISNWTSATASYGTGGDKGTPGAKNTFDITNYPAMFVSLNTPQIGQLWNVNFVSLGEPGDIYVAALAQSTGAPQFNLLGLQYPLTLDGLLAGSLDIPGFVNFLNGNGFAKTSVLIPNDPLLHGYSFFGAVGVFDMPTIVPGKVSTAVPVTVP